MNIFQKSLLVAGAIGLGSAVAAPAFAGDVQAYASGSFSAVMMNGATQSIGGEIAAPPGAGFAGTAGTGEVTVAINGGVAFDSSVNTTLLNSINVQPGLPSVTPSATASVEAAVATLINSTNATEAQGVSLTRAWRSGLQ